MKQVAFPPGFRLDPLAKSHPRSSFGSGEAAVDDWLRTKAWQHQEKHLSVTKVLIDQAEAVAGYYSLSSAQVDFGDLPAEITKKLPRRALPVAVLAWLGVSQVQQGRGLGERLVGQALLDCYLAGRTFPFVGVILDCLNDRVKKFYGRWNFREFPGNPYRLVLGAKELSAIVEAK